MTQSFFYASLFSIFFAGCSGWKRASRVSAQLAPSPQITKEAVIQVYSAPLWGLRGYVADHTWISVKKTDSHFYTVYEALGWRKFKGYSSVVRIEKDIPDRYWYGNKPTVILELRGTKAEKMIDRIHSSALEYPYKNEYSLLGPNSNTFTAWIAHQVPELKLKLSMRAIGKGYTK